MCSLAFQDPPPYDIASRQVRQAAVLNKDLETSISEDDQDERKVLLHYWECGLN